MKGPSSLSHGNPYLSWFIRGFLLLVSLFFMLFSFDVFTGEHPLGHELVGFFMHNIFTIAMLFILWLAWKHENLAGFLLVIMGVFMVFFFGGPSAVRGGTWMMISLPTVVGILFLSNYYLFSSRK